MSEILSLLDLITLDQYKRLRPSVVLATNGCTSSPRRHRPTQPKRCIWRSTSSERFIKSIWTQCLKLCLEAACDPT